MFREQEFKKRLIGRPKPSSDAELEILSEWYFGKSLHVTFRAEYQDYKVVEAYNSYHGNGFEFSEYSSDGYDHSGVFWEHVFGPLSCGGIATHSYGQFKCSYRDKKRLVRWSDSRRKGDSGRVSPAFARLAKQLNGLGENSSTPDRSCTD